MLAGLAWLAWAYINITTHGGLDKGEAAVGKGLVGAAQLLTAAWNLLLLPAALVIHEEATERNRNWMSIVTVCGIVSLAFWAFGGATHGVTPPLEVTYLLLSAVWWAGIGLSCRVHHPSSAHSPSFWVPLHSGTQPSQHLSRSRTRSA